MRQNYYLAYTFIAQCLWLFLSGEVTLGGTYHSEVRKKNDTHQFRKHLPWVQSQTELKESPVLFIFWYKGTVYQVQHIYYGSVYL
jgi:hypothetical protein